MSCAEPWSVIHQLNAENAALKEFKKAVDAIVDVSAMLGASVSKRAEILHQLRVLVNHAGVSRRSLQHPQQLSVSLDIINKFLDATLKLGEHTTVLDLSLDDKTKELAKTLERERQANNTIVEQDRQLSDVYKHCNQTLAVLSDMIGQDAPKNMPEILPMLAAQARIALNASLANATNLAANYSNCLDSNHAFEAELSSSETKFHICKETALSAVSELMDNCTAIWHKVAMESIGSNHPLTPCQVYHTFNASHLTNLVAHSYLCRDLVYIKDDDCQTMYDCILAGRQETSHEPASLCTS